MNDKEKALERYAKYEERMAVKSSGGKLVRFVLFMASRIGIMFCMGIIIPSMLVGSLLMFEPESFIVRLFFLAFSLIVSYGFAVWLCGVVDSVFFNSGEGKGNEG